MSRILITGSAQGLGRNAATSLLDDGHQVVVHARSHQRAASPVSSLARSRWPTTRSSGRRATRERRRADQSQTAAGGPSGKPTPRNRLRATGVVQCIRVARWHVCRPCVSEPHRPLTPSSAAMRAHHPSHLVGGTPYDPINNLQRDRACDASRTDRGASAARTLLARHRLDDQISVVGGIHRRCGKSKRNLDQSADVGPVQIVG